MKVNEPKDAVDQVISDVTDLGIKIWYSLSSEDRISLLSNIHILLDMEESAAYTSRSSSKLNNSVLSDINVSEELRCPIFSDKVYGIIVKLCASEKEINKLKK